jgi:PadR family transcriptional regulator PadR
VEDHGRGHLQLLQGIRRRLEMALREVQIDRRHARSRKRHVEIQEAGGVQRHLGRRPILRAADQLTAGETPEPFSLLIVLGEVAQLLPGTLDLLILKAVSLAPAHGYGILLRINQISGGALAVEQGALYPALARLERRDLLEAKWGVSDNNRTARFYRLKEAGKKRLRAETDGWRELVEAMSAALAATSAEV